MVFSVGLGEARYYGLDVSLFRGFAVSNPVLNPQSLEIIPVGSASLSELKKGDVFQAITDKGNFTLAVKYTYTPPGQPTQYLESNDWAAQDTNGVSLHQITEYSPTGRYQITEFKDNQAIDWIYLGQNGPSITVGYFPQAAADGINLELKPLGQANLTKLKPGDQYSVRATKVSDDSPLARSILDVMYVGPDTNGKEKPVEQWVSLDSNGVAVLNITSQTKPGDYILSQARIHTVTEINRFAPPANYVPRLTVEEAVEFVTLRSFLNTRQIEPNTTLQLFEGVNINLRPNSVSGSTQTHNLYDSNSRIIGTAIFTTSNNDAYKGKISFTHPETRLAAEVDFDLFFSNSSLAKTLTTFGKEQLSIIWDNEKDEISITLTSNGQLVDSIKIKQVVDKGQVVLLVYDKNGDLGAYSASGISEILETISSGDIEDFEDLGAYFLEPSGFAKPTEEQLLKYGSRKQKQEILASDPEGYRVIKEASLGNGFSYREFANGRAALYYEGQIIEIYERDAPPPVAVYKSQLSDGTWEIIFSDGTRQILSADLKTIVYTGPANVSVSAKYGVVGIITLSDGTVIVTSPNGKTLSGKVTYEDDKIKQVTAQDGSSIVIWKNGSGTMECDKARDCQIYDGGGKATWHIDSNGYVTNPGNGWNGNNPFDASRAVINFWSLSGGICSAGCGPVSGWVQATDGWHSGGYIWPDGSWSPAKGRTGPPKQPK